MSKTASAPTTNGGKPTVSSGTYSQPIGPGPSTNGSGLGGTNHGNCGTQGKR
jgi:hypothetical protein